MRLASAALLVLLLLPATLAAPTRQGAVFTATEGSDWMVATLHVQPSDWRPDGSWWRLEYGGSIQGLQGLSTYDVSFNINGEAGFRPLEPQNVSGSSFGGGIVTPAIPGTDEIDFLIMVASDTPSTPSSPWTAKLWVGARGPYEARALAAEGTNAIVRATTSDGPLVGMETRHSAVIDATPPLGSIYSGAVRVGAAGGMWSYEAAVESGAVNASVNGMFKTTESARAAAYLLGVVDDATHMDVSFTSSIDRASYLSSYEVSIPFELSSIGVHASMYAWAFSDGSSTFGIPVSARETYFVDSSWPVPIEG